MEKLINWSELSRYITGSDRNGIRANKIPKKHKEAINRLMYYLKKWDNERRQK